MTREEFITKCTLMGLGATLMPTFLTSCSKDSRSSGEINVTFNGDVIIIGGGAAGIMAAYTLSRYNTNFTILEANTTLGGRVKKIDNFADFPIDLGAEWIHTTPDVFGDLVDDSSKQGSIDLTPYNPDTIKSWNNGRLTNLSSFSLFYRERKFKSTTWFDFFEDFIMPSINGNIVLNSPVTDIDYSGARVRVTSLDGTFYEADKIIITAPIKILQEGMIQFTPGLTGEYSNAIDSFDMPDGLKVFMEFSERFYPDLVLAQGLFGGQDDSSEKLYYDAAFKKNTNRNILGLFTVGEPATPLVSLSDQELFDTIMGELDDMFDGKASQYYLKHIIQNWSAEPFVQGSYSFSGEEVNSSIELLRNGIDDKLFFAGEAITSSDSATVHGAGFSGVNLAKAILQS